MSESDFNSLPKQAESAVEITGQPMQVVIENSHTGEVPSHVGRTAVTVAGTVNNVLLPLAAFNYGVEKAKRYFEEGFAKDLQAVAAHIPPGDVVEPKASIAGPALEGLAFAHEEPDLKAMYLSLLATAMDQRAAGQVHRAFVELIKQIDPSEVKNLKSILTVPGYQAIVSIKLTGAPPNTGGYQLLCPHYMRLLEFSGKTTGDDAISFAAMVQNWIRLGLVEADYAQTLVGSDPYAWVEKQTYFKTLKEFHQKLGSTLTYQPGIIGRTNFGAKFASAVGMYNATT